MRDSSRWAVLYGGAGSSKSYSAAQKILLRSMTEEEHRFCLVRKVGKTIKVSQFALIKDLIDKWGLNDLWNVNRTELKFTYKPNGNEIISIGLDDREKIKSLTGVTGFWFEEPTEIDERDLIQMDLRLRGKTQNYKQSILTFNPISELHWLKEKYFPPYIEQTVKERSFANLLNEYEIDGQKIKLNTAIYHSTWRDNLFLDIEYKAFLVSLYDTDPAYARIYCDGEWGIIGNLVYPNGYEIIDKGNYPQEFDEVIYGLDFGVNNPTALIKIGVYDQEYFLDELIYEPLSVRLKTISGLIKEFEALDVNKIDIIYGDSATPEFITQITNAGYTIEGAIKGPGSVMAGIDKVKKSKIFSHAGNVNINREVATYKWKENDQGKPIEGEVLKVNDHGQDAIRYAIDMFTRNNQVLHIAFI